MWQHGLTAHVCARRLVTVLALPPTRARPPPDALGLPAAKRARATVEPQPLQPGPGQQHGAVRAAAAATPAPDAVVEQAVVLGNLPHSCAGESVFLVEP